jgi:uncharacterized protein DUF6401
MFGDVHGWVEASAQRTLTQLHDLVGGPGLAAAAVVPGLLAAVDQHAAAVRDILVLGVPSTGVAGAVVLAGYARGLLAQAREMGWRFGAPAGLVGWTQVDWLTARLVAVCELAQRGEISTAW